MKNKRILMLMFIAGLFAIMLFLNPKEAHATTDLTITKVTEIQRWTEYNDLIYNKVEDWDGEWYTKKVFLTEDSSGNTAIEEITDGGSLSGIQGHNGQTVYLVEKYVVNGEVDGEYLPTGDYLSLDIGDGTIVSNSTGSYTRDEAANSYRVYNGGRYTSNQATTENREITEFGFAKNVNTDAKVTSISRGSINLPIFIVTADMTASGNMMPAGHFSIQHDIYDTEVIDNSATSSLGSASGFFIYAANYSPITYSKFESPVSNVYYEWYSSEPIYKECTNTDGNNYSYQLTSSEYSIGSIEKVEVTNTYYRTVSANLEWNEAVPNGIFYNILPFVVAGIVATAGIVLLKKNSIK